MRLGKYSGKLYEENEVHLMEECGVCISDDQAKDEEYIKKHHVQDLLDCIKCCGCPRAQKGIVKIGVNYGKSNNIKNK